MKNILIAVGVSVAVVALAFAFAPVKTIVERQLGASAGPEHYETQRFRADFTSGGAACAASSTVAAVGTIGNNDIGAETNCYNFTVNQADVTLTLMASTSPWLPQSVGEVRSLFLRNASTTATADITVAGGTGINLKSATSTKTIRGDTGADNYARIDFVRQSDSDVNAHLELYVD